MNSRAATLCYSADEVFEQLLDDITARIHAGELIDLDACVAEHPEYAHELEQLVPAMEVLMAFGCCLTSAGGGDLFVAKLVQSGITSSLSATQHTAANARTTRSIGKAASSLARVPIAIDLALADADDWLDDLLLLVV
jgi:hypothetical protein